MDGIEQSDDDDDEFHVGSGAESDEAEWDFEDEAANMAEFEDRMERHVRGVLRDEAKKRDRLRRRPQGT